MQIFGPSSGLGTDLPARYGAPLGFDRSRGAMLGLVPLACRRSIHVLDQILRGGTMPVSFSDLQLACEFVSSGDMGENESYLDRQSGNIYWHSEFGDNDEELPDDIDDEKYISIPDKRPRRTIRL